MTAPLRTRRLLATVVSCAAAALTLAACGGGAQNVTGDDGRIALTLATVATDSCAQSFIGEKQGIFAAHGIDVTLDVVAGVPELAAAVTSGQADLACSAPTAVASGINQGLPFTMIAPGIEYRKDNPGSFLMTPAGSSITSVSQLAGTTLAVNALNTLPHLSTMAMLQDAGVDPASVTFVNLAFPNIGQALETGQVQSGVLQPPYQDDMEANGGRKLASPYDAVNGGNPFVYTVWFGTKDFAAQNPAAVTAIQEAMAEVSTWSNDPANADTRRAILAGATGQDPAVVARSALSYYGTELTPELIQSQLDLQRRFGTLPKELNAADLITAAPATS
ncbi:ABC transporter substrate-binding protein [Pseudonocardia xishanensis]|uniref:Solute-binding protein family 3/N-terminal domain-containing protein n=1 Tax=Pseudonocardia xishanensis TaxID=630995 RepID=A0ABP8RMW6_9PSEU